MRKLTAKARRPQAIQTAISAGRNARFFVGPAQPHARIVAFPRQNHADAIAALQHQTFAALQRTDVRHF